MRNEEGVDERKGATKFNFKIYEAVYIFVVHLAKG